MDTRLNDRKYTDRQTEEYKNTLYPPTSFSWEIHGPIFLVLLLKRKAKKITGDALLHKESIFKGLFVFLLTQKMTGCFKSNVHTYINFVNLIIFLPPCDFDSQRI